MELKHAWNWELWIIAAIGAALLASVETSNAGMVMLDDRPDPKAKKEKKEEYAESHWGAAPAKPKVAAAADPTAARESNYWPAPEPVEPRRQVASVDAQGQGSPATPGMMAGELGTVQATRLDREPASLAAPSQQKTISAIQTPPGMEAAAMRRQGVQELSLIVSDQGFFPKMVFVTRDMPVRLFVTGASKNTLCLMMDAFQVRKQVRSQTIEEIDFTPTIPGKYRFYCPVNGVEGNLIVRELGQEG